MNYQRKSNFADVIIEFIAYKHAHGYLYETAEHRLNLFDRFCFELFSTESILSKEIGLCWAEKRQTEKISNQRGRIVVIRELAKYINSRGGNAFVIPLKITGRPSRYIPHIFTKDELSTFFYAVDHLPYCYCSPGRHLVFPVMFRLLYCCGLRPKEARTLLVENVDLKTGVIKIIDSKRHKDRNIVLAHDVLKLCRKYWRLISEIYPASKYFFPNKHDYYTRRGIIDCFDLSCQKAGLSDFKGNSPTLYGLRHTFATHCLYRWMQESKDLNAYLPYLSMYMGHAKLSDTAYYIHLIPEFFPQMGNMNIDKFESLLPEVKNEH
jgi:integrase